MEPPSLGDQFTGGPFGAGAGAAAGAVTADDEELELLERLAQDPTDIDAHMALLRMYYELQDADKFEPAASAFYAQHPDPDTWERVAAMGRELLPGNLMFAEQLHATQEMPAPVSAADEDATRHDLDFDFDFGMHEQPVAPPPAAAPEVDPVRFDFDTPPPPSRVKAPDADLDLDADTEPELPSFEFDTSLDQPEVTAVDVPEVETTELEFSLDTPTPPPPPRAPAPPVEGRAPDFMGEDAVGTKLDLARAYMDMGDPDGAKSMLQEVINEGSAAQREEARRLLDDLT
jgi:pilus assembly protein FimV